FDFRLANVARQLGAAAALLGDPLAARIGYDRGIEWASAIRHRPEIALTRFQLAELLLDKSVTPTPFESDGAEAMAHLDFAIEEFRAMKMQSYLERALGHKIGRAHV